MIDNPPSDQHLVTLSVQVTDGGELSIAENVHPKPPCEPEKARGMQASVRQSGRSSNQYTKAVPSRKRTRVSSRRKPKNDPQNVSSVGPKNNYRTVHFTLGSTRVLKESWFLDGSTQVELRPLGLLDQHVPPVYGCIDSRGELRMSMGKYNQNALGRMASLVAAMGLEEKPDTVNHQPKRVVLIDGKTWPTFPVAVTIVDNETPSQSTTDPSTGAPSAVASSQSCVAEPERYSRLHQTHNPIPTVQMLQDKSSPVVRPMTSTATGPCGIRTQYQELASRSIYTPVATGKAVVLVAENENNSSSNSVTQATLRTESLKLRKADPNDTHYGSTESLCSINLPEGRLYIAEGSGNSPQLTGSIPGQIHVDKNYSSSRQTQSHEMSKILMGHDTHHNQSILSNIATKTPAHPKTAGIGEINHRNNNIDCINDVVDKTDLPLETNKNPMEKNNCPVPTSSPVDAPSDIGGKSDLATSGSSFGPGEDSMDEFLKYLQHLNTVMETVMAGGTDKPITE